MVDTIERLFARFDGHCPRSSRRWAHSSTPAATASSTPRSAATACAHTLAEHRALLEQSDWESILDYETHWMTRAEIVDAAYDAAERLNALKLRYGRIDANTAAGVRERLTRARSLHQKLSHGSPDAALDREIREASGEQSTTRPSSSRPRRFCATFGSAGFCGCWHVNGFACVYSLRESAQRCTASICHAFVTYCGLCPVASGGTNARSRSRTDSAFIGIIVSSVRMKSC
ncbi:MAG TPA: hypothetical protein VJ840_12265 [Gemmatimonadaceae bacterium]|nr:hypothetical protein [Gemmatimonadaceae bacterium]